MTNYMYNVTLYAVKSFHIFSYSFLLTTHCNIKYLKFFCVGVMYSGEYDACDVTLSVYPHRASLKNLPDTVGIEPTTFGILAQCSAN